MSEHNEIIINILCQYFKNIKNIKVLVIESYDNIYKELSKYKIKNIQKFNDITQIKNKDDTYDLIIFEQYYVNNISNNDINKLIEKTKIIILPEKKSSYLDYFYIKSNNFVDIISKYKNQIKISDKIYYYYSNIIDPINYFVDFKNYENLETKPIYYKPENHFKYFVDNPKSEINLIMGTHIMLDFKDVNFNLLENIEHIKNLMNDIAIEEKFVILNTVSHKFEPQGFTMIFLLSTSHFSIHTYPEHNKCSIDLYSCDMNVDYNNVINKLKIGLKSENFRLHQVIRKI